jgi:cobalamin biosynthesis protein CbiG
MKDHMTDYRAYIIGTDGYFHSFEIIAAPDDEIAVEAAKKLVNGSGVEVWDLDRKVAVLPASE